MADTRTKVKETLRVPWVYSKRTIAIRSGWGRYCSSVVFCIAIFLLYSCQTEDQEAYQLPEQVSFNFDIQPILSNNCYVCHGPDSSTRQADLRLDLRKSATGKLKSGSRAVHPGNWKKSELIRRVSSHDPEIMMPPPELKRQLSNKEIALLKRWIEQGAEWEPYWAFTQPKDPAVPIPVELESVNNEIDKFIVSKLEQQQLNPAPIADRGKLARRLSFVLTGLPPDPTVVTNFINDNRPDAYQRLVQYYLDTDRFGENWARHWMDLVRYADTRGHEFDYPVVGAWHYRDYLIRAFNNDVPYNQLILEHLAGDLLELPRFNNETGINESVIGTAFYCLTEGKHSPVDLRIDQSERIDNIIDVTSKTFQALTVACAKCHDHKFDPIPTTDYYSMYGMIESTRFTLTQVGLDNRKRVLLDSLEQDLGDLKSYIREKVSGVSDPDPSPREDVDFDGNYQLIGDFRDGSLAGWTPDGIAFRNSLGMPIVQGNLVVGLESGKASSKVMGKGLYGVLRSPGFVIEEDSMLFRAAGKNSVIRVIIDNFQLIQNPIYGQLQTHIKSDDLKDYKIDLSMWKGHHAYIELLVGDYMRRKGKGAHDYDLDKEAWLEVEYVLGYESTFSRRLPDEIHTKPHRPIAEVISDWLDGKGSSRDIRRLNLWFKQNQPLISDLKRRLERSNRYVRALYDSSFVVGVTDGDYIASPVFIRGSLNNLSSYEVPHRFLNAVSDTNQVFQTSGSGRLEFAKSIASRNNPLTARVMVNRLWHHIFGRGIVETVDNFGVQGKIPSHPALLDYLALKFMDEGWSIKKMIKFMVMSQAFQRETSPSQAALAEDPGNILLQHYPVRRLNAESIRDAILATSGRLDTTMYGPPVPVYLTEFLSGRGRPRKSGPLDGDGRRSIYQALNRNFLPPMMLAFDMPVPFSTFGRRNVSNVPSQSLTLLNDPFIANQAAFWAKNMLVKSKPDFESRVSDVYLKAFARAPTPVEIANARAFFDEQATIMTSTAGTDNQELELWKSYCHSIFNMKEFIFLI